MFLFCRKQDGAPPWPAARRIIGEKLLAFFRLFGEKIGELSQSTTCTCNACAHIEKLRLKVVVHSGEALFHRVLNFVELAGVDVIIVHRLLKNSVNADQYLLLTEAARPDVEFAGKFTWQKERRLTPTSACQHAGLSVGRRRQRDASCRCFSQTLHPLVEIIF